MEKVTFKQRLEERESWPGRYLEEECSKYREQPGVCLACFEEHQDLGIGSKISERGRSSIVGEVGEEKRNRSR